MLATNLLNILVCPVCNGPLLADDGLQALCCPACGLEFPVREDIPVMLADEAQDIKGPGPGCRRK